MEPSLAPELLVTENIAVAAVRLFLEIQPRTLTLAGGSTPRAFYERLRHVGYDWHGVDVFFGDERCVPDNHPDSNFRMAEEALLSKVAARVHRIDGERCDPDIYERELEASFGAGFPRFDLVVMGLGEDGHTASLFPGDPALDILDRSVARVSRPDHARITLTFPVFSAANVALFLVEGSPKAGALKQLLEGSDIPASRVKARRVVILADPAAASFLGDR